MPIMTLTIEMNIEEAHVQRIGDVAELALRRDISLPTLMEQLGIKPKIV
jgi:hypothetical protein